MKPFLTTFLAAAAAIIGLLCLPLGIGVWLPDVIFAPRNTLAEQHLASGHSFRVIQYWNRSDFYNTELLHTLPDGSKKTHLLDPDDMKSWNVPLIIDEEHKTATVTLSHRRTKTVDWK